MPGGAKGTQPGQFNKKMRSIVLVLLIATVAFGAKTGVQDQILALLQTGTKAHDAIDSVFELLNDLKESNADAQYAADAKNASDEEIGQATIGKFTQVKSLNQKISDDALRNRQHFEQELRETKSYLSWNEARQEEIQRKSASLLENQCYSNQLFVRSLKQAQEAIDVIALLKQDLQGYIAAGSEFDLVQVSKSDIKSVADKLKGYSNIIHASEVQAFLQLADATEETEEEEERSAPGKRRGTLPEQLVQVLDDLQTRVQESLANLESNQIEAAWQLAQWLSSSEAELVHLQQEHERKALYADRAATQIQAALAAQAKATIVLQESEDALQQAITDLTNKREVYAEGKAKRDEENAILDEVITQFKNQVSSWSGRF